MNRKKLIQEAHKFITEAMPSTEEIEAFYREHIEPIIKKAGVQVGRLTFSISNEDTPIVMLNHRYNGALYAIPITGEFFHSNPYKLKFFVNNLDKIIEIANELANGQMTSNAPSVFYSDISNYLKSAFGRARKPHEHYMAFKFIANFLRENHIRVMS